MQHWSSFRSLHCRMLVDGDNSEPSAVTLWLCRSVGMFVMLLSLASIFIFLWRTYVYVAFVWVQFIGYTVTQFIGIFMFYEHIKFHTPKYKQ